MTAELPDGIKASFSDLETKALEIQESIEHDDQLVVESVKHAITLLRDAKVEEAIQALTETVEFIEGGEAC